MPNFDRADINTDRPPNTCANGHTLTPENTFVTARGYRECKECRRVYARKAYARNPAYTKEYKAKNLDKYKAYQREWREKNREKRNADQRAARAARKKDSTT